MAFPQNPQRPYPSNSELNSRLRILFLDDDPQRAEVFLEHNPQAVWVETVPDCLARLLETWDEVHLDHDLGGEQYVTHEREDCGMEVVRWLSLESRPHLKPTKFVVHSHNPNGATMMGMQLMVNGYNVEVRPFGETPVVPSTPASPTPTYQPTLSGPRPRTFLDALRYKLLTLFRPLPPGLDPAILEQIRANAARRANALNPPRGASPSDSSNPAETGLS